MGKKRMGMVLFLIILLQCSVFAIAEEPHKLYFSSADGQLYYNKETTGLEYFLNFQEMYPGQTYTNELEIANETNTTYQLYFQLKPKSTLPEDLDFLSQIEMKLYYDDVLLYQGSAEKIFPTKADYSVTSEMISLGEYAPHQVRKLRAEVQLNKTYWDGNQTVTSYYLMDDNGEYTIESKTKPTEGKYRAVSKSVGDYKSQMAETTWMFYGEEETTGGEVTYHRLTYIAEEGGYLSGTTSQRVRRGSNGTQVIAVAKEGYEFIDWDDGVNSASRQEKNVRKDGTFIARFKKLGGGDPTDPPTPPIDPPTNPPTDPPTDPPVPEDPDNPVTPPDPEIPDNPDNPDKPLIPIVPAPKTGDSGMDGYFMALIIATSILVILVASRINEKKRKTKGRVG